MTNAHSGFTLIELSITVAIIGVLYSLASPNLQELISRWHIRQQYDLLRMALNTAREHAIHQQQRVTLCPLSSQQRCHHDWNQPLTLFTDTNNNQQLDSNEKILLIFPAVSSSQALRGFNNYAISFNSQGQAGYAVGSLSYCLIGQGTHGLVFIVSRTGRVRSESSLHTGQLPSLANGNALPCPPS